MTTLDSTPQGAAKKICSVEDCGRSPAIARGLCSMHYKRFMRGSEFSSPGPKKTEYCSVEGCGRPHKARGLCQRHYSRKMAGDKNWDAPIYEKPSSDICSVDGCSNKVRHHGICYTHYYRKREGQEDWDTRPIRKREQGKPEGQSPDQ